MSDLEPQRFISYRSISDQFEIRFFGGPLDGARIVTDILPDNETFVHRIHDRNYVYRYRYVSKGCFHARLDAFETPERPREPRVGSMWGRLAIAALVVLLLCILWGALRLLQVAG